MQIKEASGNRKTRDQITEALIELTKEKDLSRITITELCDAADVSRMAFYRNFSSKENVLERHLADLLGEYREATQVILRLGGLWYGTGHLNIYFDFLKTNSEFIDCLYRCGYIVMLLDVISSFLIETWGNETPAGDYVLTAFAGSICACYKPWAERGFAETPLEMAGLIGRFYRTMPSAEQDK